MPRKNGSGRSPQRCGDVAGGERGDGDGAVAGGFVEAHRESAPGGADEVDLHDHRRRPGEALVDAEQDVGEDHPSPSRRPDQQQRDREGDDPPGDQHRLAAVAVGQGAGEEVRRRLDGAEGDDERERRGERGEPELLLGEQREHGAFLADHPADERVDADEQRELAEVLLEAEPQRCVGRGGAHRPVSNGRPVAVDQVSGPPSSTSDVIASGRGEDAGAGHRPFTMATHHGHRSGRRDRRGRRRRARC